MTLQRTIYFVVIGLYGVGLLAALAMIVGIVINLFRPNEVNAFPLALLFFGCLLLRFILILWLRRLGGIPQEFRPK